MSDDLDDRAGRDPAPAVTRSIRLLELLAEARRPLNLTEIAGGLGLAKSSTANLCLALEAARMIERGAQGYRLGLRTAELGGAFAAQFNQVREFYDICDASPVLAGELVQIAILDGADALYIARHEGSRSLRIGTPLGSRLPAALSATGRAMLSTLTDAEVTALVGRDAVFPPVTQNSTRDLAGLLSRLVEARERGWALDAEESFPGIVGVAVPLEGWAPGDPQLAIGVGIPVAEATPEHVDAVAAALRDVARQLTNPFSAAARRG
ncbi:MULTISPECIES: IclR family transcriptional regulator [Microbacterium]|uniref:IclR family transcriptional regulator n=1 Tax=Microbacterium hominis TaxID=162426 RepID=A0A2K9DE74_9MICO|nr:MULTISPECIES: IclR family transcriptional regulator [Microbacterium]AUG29219.1 IclR family transcriptional regulator [Microbacterium hominis]QOC25091.1 IclR family transcriptional regulator [Microbacterium hominis]QOC29134.1 IclR family transcriptional regulator [Microbacterium hominis]QYF98649.1 IclR family transcriptional regulator [Microbacterium sp. PAMC21962]